MLLQLSTELHKNNNYFIFHTRGYTYSSGQQLIRDGLKGVLKKMPGELVIAHHITPMMGYIVDSFFIDILELIFIFLFHLISAS